MAETGNVTITQRKSTIGCPPDQIGTMRALGLKKIGQSVTKTDNPTLRGMIFKVKHLIEVDDGDGA
jgi:large subunit ribosomal protein L30